MATAAAAAAAVPIAASQAEGPPVSEGEPTGLEEAGAWDPGLPGVAPAELLWRKWLFIAAAPVAAIVIAAGAWAILASRGTSDVQPLPPVEAPQEPMLVAEPAPPESEELDVKRPALDPWWLPSGTRLLVSVQTSALAGRDELGDVMPLTDPVWRAVFADLIEAFGLRIETIRRLSWASTDLAAWPEPGLIIIEFEEGQDAGVFRALGEGAGIELAGQSCRRLTKGAWPHPFAVPDALTIVTGRESLLRELAGRSEPHLESRPIDRLLRETASDAELMMLMDLGAARESGWRLPTSLLDVWPPGRDAWHVLWETPQGMGLWLRRGGNTVSEIGLACEGETSANGVHSALGTLIPAAQGAIEAGLASLDDRLRAGRITVDAADQYEVVLSEAAAALKSTRWEVADELVWVRTDWGHDASALVAAAIGSRPVIRAEWLEAAQAADRENHRQLLTGLDGYRRAEGHFPAGAGGGTLLPPETRLSWIAMMLPYYGHRDWHRELDFRLSWNGSQNRPITRRRLDSVVNPALGPSNTEAGFPVTHYVGVAGLGADAATLEAGHRRAGLFGFNRAVRMEDIPDGASNTIALLGVSGRLGAWAAGGDATVRGLTQRPYVNGPDGFGSGQPGGMLAGMADGSVRFVSKDIDPAVLEQLATIGGREDSTVAALEPLQPSPPASPPQKAPPEPDQLAEKPEPQEPDKSETELVDQELVVGPEAPLPKVDVQARLADPVSGITLPDVPLADAVELVAQISTLRISFDVEAMARLGVSVRDPVTTELSDATVGRILEAILSSRGLVYVIQDDQILVTSPERKRNALGPARYDVSDLTGRDPGASARLAALVTALVAPESWRQAGGRGTVEVKEDALEAVQTEAVHHHILTFCQKLRLARGMPLESGHGPGALSLATHWDAARAMLQQPVTSNFREPAPLVRILSDLEELTGTQILVDWPALAGQGISPEEVATLNAADLPFAETLDGLLRPLGLAYRVVDGETLEVTTQKAASARLELEFYATGGLLSEGVTPGGLVQRIQDQAGGTTWSDAGGPGMIHFDEPSQCLIVLQSQPVQVELESLLERWRADKTGTPPAE